MDNDIRQWLDFIFFLFIHNFSLKVKYNKLKMYYFVIVYVNFPSWRDLMKRKL